MATVKRFPARARKTRPKHTHSGVEPPTETPVNRTQERTVNCHILKAG